MPFHSGSHNMFRMLIFLCVYLLTQSVQARIPDITDAEKALTSPFCIDTEAFGGAHQCQGGRTPKSHYWQRVLGNGFCHLHHYCWAEIHLLRANKHSTSPEERQRQFQYAIGEFSYVIRHSPRDFVLLPEVYTRLGQAALRINDYTAADDAFRNARELKPDYWPAYSHWAEYLIRVGEHSAARKIVTDGLHHAPNAKTLLDQLQRLGGVPANSGKTGQAQ